MPYEFLKVERDGGGDLALNRPDRLNAWHQPMRAELADAVRSLVHDDPASRAAEDGSGRC